MILVVEEAGAAVITALNNVEAKTSDEETWGSWHASDHSQIAVLEVCERFIRNCRGGPRERCRNCADGDKLWRQFFNPGVSSV